MTRKANPSRQKVNREEQQEEEEEGCVGVMNTRIILFIEEEYNTSGKTIRFCCCKRELCKKNAEKGYI